MEVDPRIHREIELGKLPIHLTAIDISPDLLALARLEKPGSDIAFFTEDACRTTFNDNAFNAVIGSSILHHTEIGTVLAEIYRLLKPGGKMAFTEPNMMNPHIALERNIPALRRSMGNSPDETAFFSWSLRRRLKNSGFTRIDIIPFDFLHPAIPGRLIKYMLPVTKAAEKIPVLRQFSGSLFIKAEKNET